MCLFFCTIKVKIAKDANGNTQVSLVDDGNGTVKIDANGNITWLEPEVKVSFLKTDEAGKPLAVAIIGMVVVVILKKKNK